MDLKKKTSSLPSRSGVYLLKDSKSNIIYIGKAKSLKNRLSYYFQNRPLNDIKTRILISKISDFEVVVTDSEMEALILEANLIKEHHPKYNINLKDDKRYPYIKITTYDRFPRILVVRRIKKDKARYFGPYTDVGRMRQTLRNMERIFPLKKCAQTLPSKTVKRSCLNFDMKKCLAPCQGNVKEEEYAELISNVILFLSGRNTALSDELKNRMHQFSEEQKYEMAAKVRDQLRALKSMTQEQKVADAEAIDRDIIALAREKGDVSVVVFQVREGILIARQHFYLSTSQNDPDGEILTSFLKQYYLNSAFVPKQVVLPVNTEDREIIGAWLSSKKEGKVELILPQRGDKLKIMEMATSNAKLLLAEFLFQKAEHKGRIPTSVESLKEILQLDVLPRKIAAFDISNLGNTDAAGSVVYFQDGKPKKSQYRQFKIKTVEGQNDFAMMEEVIKRYFQNLKDNQVEFPDLVLVDGGKGQLRSALKSLKSIGVENQAVIGLAKRLDEVFVPEKEESLVLSKRLAAIRLIQRIRDEAHRFAIRYHKQLREKRTGFSELDKIEGIGKVRKRALLLYFGSVERIRDAELEEMLKVRGIKRKTAEAIYDFFHTKQGSAA